jgi:hypothetical protein
MAYILLCLSWIEDHIKPFLKTILILLLPIRALADDSGITYNGYTLSGALEGGRITFEVEHEGKSYQINNKDWPYFFHRADRTLEMTFWGGPYFHHVPVSSLLLSNLRFLALSKNGTREYVTALPDESGRRRAGRFDTVVVRSNSHSPTGYDVLARFIALRFEKNRQVRDSILVPIDQVELHEFDSRPSFQSEGEGYFEVQVGPGQFVTVRLLGFYVSSNGHYQPIVYSEPNANGANRLNGNVAIYRLPSVVFLSRVDQPTEANYLGRLPNDLEWRTYIQQDAAWKRLSEVDIARELFLVPYDGVKIPVDILYTSESGKEDRRKGTAYIDVLGGRPFVVADRIALAEWVARERPSADQNLFFLSDPQSTAIRQVGANQYMTMPINEGWQPVKPIRLQINLKRAKQLAGDLRVETVIIDRIDADVMHYESNKERLIRLPMSNLSMPIVYENLIHERQKVALTTRFGLIPVIVLGVQPDVGDTNVLIIGRWDYNSGAQTADAYWVHGSHLVALSESKANLKVDLPIADFLPEKRKTATFKLYSESHQIPSDDRLLSLFNQAEEFLNKSHRRVISDGFEASISNRFDQNLLDFTRSLGWPCPVSFWPTWLRANR